MKGMILVAIMLGVLGMCYGADEVGTIPCAASVPNVETDAFTPRNSWTAGGKNYTTWDHRFNFFSSSATYTVYDMLVYGEPYIQPTEIVSLWELEPVPGHSGYFHFPAWRRASNVGIHGGQTHSFGYNSASTGPFASMMIFTVYNYTCTPGFQLWA